MAFGMPVGGSGDIVPFIKYNAKAGRMFRVDRIQTTNGWETEETDITKDFVAVMDLEDILIGWVHYGAKGPQRVMGVYKKEDPPECPGDEFKPGFSVRLVLDKSQWADGETIREFGSNSALVMNAMGDLYDKFADDRQSDKLAIVSLADVVTEKGQHGTNYRPVFDIVGWTDRPEALRAQAKLNAQSSVPRSNQRPETGSTQMPPPTQQAEPAAASHDFG